MPDYNMLFQAPNAGQAFQQSFQQGQLQQRSNMARHAMSRLASNPDDQKALSDLAAVDPETAMQFRKQNLEYHKATLAEHQDSIVKGAQILRQFAPKDQAGYTQALAAAQQAGIDISQVPQQYNQQYVDGIIHIADALHPEAGSQDPGMIREYDIATTRGLIPQGTSYQQFLQMKNPGMMSPVTIPYGATVSTPGQGAPPARVTDKASYDAVPPGGQYMDPEGHVRTKGGQAGQSSPANFSGPYYP